MLARLIFSAAAAFAAAPVLAQDATGVAPPETQEWPKYAQEAPNGSVVHVPSGAICPATLSDVPRVNVFEATNESGHVGVVCEYKGQDYRSFALFITNKNHPTMKGLANVEARWEESLKTITTQYPEAAKISIGGLGADVERGVNGQLFESTIQDAPVQIGIWQTEAENWVVKARATFAPTIVGWQAAATARALVGDNATMIEVYTPNDDAGVGGQ